MVPSVRMLYTEDIIHLQQDHSSIHDSLLIQEWLSWQADVKFLDRPPRAPDMNRIEKMWGEVKRKMQEPGRSSRPEIAMSYRPLCQTRGINLLCLRVTFDHWLSSWHDEWNQWSKQKGSGLLIREVNFWKQPLKGLFSAVCLYWDSNQRSLFPKDNPSTHSTAWAT